MVGTRMITRRGVLRTLGGMTALGAAGGMYAFWIEPAYRLGVAEYRLNPPGWPAGRPITIAALSDIHAGEPHMPLERVNEIVQATNALRPDLVVLLGDYPAAGKLVTQPIPVAETVEVLKGLRAPHGVHSVLGNHDWWDDVQVQRFRRGLPRIARTLADARISVLHNSAVKSGFRGQGFWVAGCGSLWAFDEGGGAYRGANDLNRTLAAVTDRDPVILLCHEPDIFPQVPRDRVALTLAGHTHGGQVRLFGWSPYVPSAYGNRYAYGHVEEEGKHLVVSGGLGTAMLPVRLGVPPEITLVRLGHG
jgi:predicted MPP superfamily phosphohydrolase